MLRPCNPSWIIKKKQKGFFHHLQMHFTSFIPSQAKLITRMSTANISSNFDNYFLKLATPKLSLFHPFIQRHRFLFHSLLLLFFVRYGSCHGCHHVHCVSFFFLWYATIGADNNRPHQTTEIRLSQFYASFSSPVSLSWHFQIPPLNKEGRGNAFVVVIQRQEE